MSVRIDGATRLYAIVGDPIVQVRSPEVYTEAFAAAGRHAVLVPLQILPAAFDRVMPALLEIGNLDGVLVTAPFKARVLPFAARLGTTARTIGAANALRREADGTWTGEMFDGAGFVHGALRKGLRLAGRRVLQFGAGGAGSAIACALAEAGVASLRLVDLDAARAQALAMTLRAAFPRCDITAGAAHPDAADMIVNASTIGMRPGDGLPGEVGALRPDTLVGDVVISDSPTALVRRAIESGCAWVNGRDMHSGQIEAIMGFFASPDERIEAGLRASAGAP